MVLFSSRVINYTKFSLYIGFFFSSLMLFIYSQYSATEFTKILTYTNFFYLSTSFSFTGQNIVKKYD